MVIGFIKRLFCIFEIIFFFLRTSVNIILTHRTHLQLKTHCITNNFLLIDENTVQLNKSILLTQYWIFILYSMYFYLDN